MSAATPQSRHYGRLRQEGEGWVLEAIPPHVAIRLKQLFPRIPKAATAPFRFPDTPEACADLAWFCGRYPMEMQQCQQRALQSGRSLFEDQQAERERILLPDYRPPPRPGLLPGRALRNYQARAVELLGSRKALLCGDEVGLGKTVVAVGALLLPEALPAAIVIEPHLQTQWAQQIRAFTGLRVVEIKTTKAKSLPPADVYLWRYSNLGGWVDVIREMAFGLVAWDEIQALRKGRDTQKGRASWVLAQRARYRLGLTATPIYNYGSEIYEVLQFIDQDVLGSKKEFCREWLGRLLLKDGDALGSYLREQHVFVRRRRADVGRELPPVNTIVETVESDAKVLADAEALARKLAIRATTGDFLERGQASRELDAMLRHETGVAKAPGVSTFVRLLLEAGEPVLLAGWHRAVYDIWLERLKDFQPALYTGSETAAGKARSKDAFLSGETDLLIISLRSGAGLDGLQERCKTVVFGELDWSPGIHHQVIGRLDRDRADGQPNQVAAFYLVSDDGADPPMIETLGIKKSEAQAVVDPGLGLAPAHSDQSHLRRLVERYLKRRGGRQ